MIKEQNINKYEIMAPVGSRESLMAAIQAGANSIYFGIGQLNMRSHSANHFTIDDLHEIASICSEHGIKSYLTVNTIIYGGDIETMHRIVDAAKEAKVSAVIAADVAVIMYCRSIGVEVHLSTQLNITNIDSLKFYAQYADVVVLARELNMEQVSEIYQRIIEDDVRGPNGELIRIEMFCHGALCMAVSGKCYLSIDNEAHSANRGDCRQLCRRSYIVTDKEKKDKWDEELSKVFNRGFWDGYYQGQKLGEWNKNYGSAATEKKVLVGKVVKYFSKIGVAEIAVTASEIEKGERILITGPTTGVMYLDANEIRYDLNPVEKVEKGWNVSIPVTDKVRPNDKVFKLVTVAPK